MIKVCKYQKYVYLCKVNKAKQNLKHRIMKTQMENTVSEITVRLVNGINRWNQQGVELKSRLLSALEMEVSFLSFENETAKQMFSSAVLRNLAIKHATHYQVVYPPYIYK